MEQNFCKTCGNLECGPQSKIKVLSSELAVHPGWWERRGHPQRACAGPRHRRPELPPERAPTVTRAEPRGRCLLPCLLHTPPRAFSKNLIHNLANLDTVEAGFLTNTELTGGTYLDN